MIPLADAFGAAVVTAVMGAGLVAAEVCARTALLGPEAARKLTHVAGGVACLVVHVLVRSPLTVLALAVVMACALTAGERMGVLTCLCGVGRRGLGAPVFAAAVPVLFAVTGGRRWVYVCAVLVLAVSDSAAAVVGRRYGAHAFSAFGSRKTLEGSTAFLFSAAVIVFASLRFGAEAATDVAMAGAVVVALMATVLEAVSANGVDNAAVPLFVCLGVGFADGGHAPMVAGALAGLVALAVTVGAYTQPTAITDPSAYGGHLAQTDRKSMVLR